MNVMNITDIQNLYGVMLLCSLLRITINPPFNVDEVSFDRVNADARFNTYGVPRNATKSAKKQSDKKETVPNANYLWIGYFATAMNDHGKAALVMANSASDAGKSEYEIRKKMIEEGMYNVPEKDGCPYEYPTLSIVQERSGLNEIQY